MGPLAKKLNHFFQNIGNNSEETYEESTMRPIWNTGLTYASEITAAAGSYDKKSLQGYSSGRYQEKGRD